MITKWCDRADRLKKGGGCNGNECEWTFQWVDRLSTARITSALTDPEPGRRALWTGDDQFMGRRIVLFRLSRNESRVDARCRRASIDSWTFDASPISRADDLTVPTA